MKPLRQATDLGDGAADRTQRAVRVAGLDRGGRRVVVAAGGVARSITHRVTISTMVAGAKAVRDEKKKRRGPRGGDERFGARMPRLHRRRAQRRTNTHVEREGGDQ